MAKQKELFLGLDVGSTTAKVVVIDNENNILWQKYSRHNAHQQELVLDYLKQIEAEFGSSKFTIFATGSGGKVIADMIGGKHIQEVNAVTVAVEYIHPNAGSVVELGGQDAKVILWNKAKDGRKTSISYMNDKCAGGTGASLDRIFSKVNLHIDDIQNLSSEGVTIHHIAAKCGVFAETDVVGLLKAGVDEKEIVVSLCAAIVKQNIEVLLHGNALTDDVILLGGPHTYFKAFAEIWRKEIPKLWDLHKIPTKNKPIEELVYVPENSQYYAAIGAVLFGKESYKDIRNNYTGYQKLKELISQSLSGFAKPMSTSRDGLVQSAEEVEEFAKEYRILEFEQPNFGNQRNIDCFLGIDGGSTSSKMVLIDNDGELLYKDYVLSKGNPIVDITAMFAKLSDWQKETGISFNVKSSGVTGYASDILKKAFSLDSAIVETIAHLKSATHYYGDLDIICDVGGQDIKVMYMKHGRVVDIKLNTQCSAGNGYFLQSMANQFNIPIEEYADRAFTARKAPVFNYGCAVFMEQDKVNFQQLGWSKEEIMAGLALVLPQNIWNYVVQETNLNRVGSRFLLQGGTQKNLAAVKAQVDFIKERVDDAKVYVHKYADVAGAIGAAIEAKNTIGEKTSTFGDFEAASKVSFTTQNDESTRCRFCSNYCTRNFIDIKTTSGETVTHISGYACDKGASVSLEEMKAAQAKKKQLRGNSANLVARSEELLFQDYTNHNLPNNLTSKEAKEKRAEIVVGIPRLLNLFYYAPFFNAYFKTLGVKDVVYSDKTSKKLWEEGNKWGSIDPCFPAKVAPAHVHNLLKKKNVTHICFPMITHIESNVQDTLGNNACVIQMGTPEVVHAAFTRQRDHFKESDKEYWKPLIRMDRRPEALGNLYEYFKDRLLLTEEENAFAVNAGFEAMEKYLGTLRDEGTDVLNDLVENDRIGVLFIGHPYHHDSGLNHNIPEEFQALNFPVLCIESLPISEEFLAPLFMGKEYDETQKITDVWIRNFNRNTNTKLWAAKVASRHQNLAVIDMSSFKCGHDAPTYSYIDRILDASGTPHFLFHDVDQNKPSASIKIRVQSIKYFLEEEQRLLKEKYNVNEIVEA